MGRSQSVKRAYKSKVHTDNVDVKAEVNGAVANAVANTFDNLVNAIVVNVIC